MFELSYLESRSTREVVSIIDNLPWGAMLLGIGLQNEYCILHSNEKLKQSSFVELGIQAGRSFVQCFHLKQEQVNEGSFVNGETLNISLYVNGVKKQIEIKFGLLNVCKNVYPIAYISDTTLLLNATNRALKAEQELKVILENTRFGIKQMTPELDILNANRMACKAMSSDINSLIGSKCYVHVGNDDPCPNCPVLLSIDTKSPQEHIQEPGNGRSYLINSVPVLNMDNEVSSIIEFFEDITDVKEKEAYLIESENKFKNIFEYSNDSIFLVSNGVIADCNITACKTFIVNGKDDLIGRDFTSLVNTESVTQSEDHLIEYLGSMPKEKMRHFDLDFKKSDKSFFHGSVSSSSIKIKGKQYQQIIIHDITLRKQTEVELLKAKIKAEEAANLKSLFLANMSHEIRTPLNSLLGFSELLFAGQLDKQDHEQYLKLILSSGDQLLHLVNDILDISQIESGQLEIKKEPIHINSILDRLYKIYSAELRSKPVTLKITKGLNNDNCYIVGHEGKLTQVLCNLISNAIKFTPKGCIHIGYVIVDHMIQFFVEDTGFGIDDESQDAIFDRFMQAGTVKQKEKGAGLGLAICKGLVNLLGGDIWLNSQLGSGTVVYFSLPLECN
jgi:PAS domain S-box-containing protein